MADNDNKNQNSELAQTQNDLEHVKIEEDKAEETKEEKERKITQTDHLNKRLLSAFLDRININPNLVQGASGGDNPEENNFSDTELSDSGAGSFDLQKHLIKDPKS